MGDSTSFSRTYFMGPCGRAELSLAGRQKTPRNARVGRARGDGRGHGGLGGGRRPIADSPGAQRQPRSGWGLRAQRGRAATLPFLLRRDCQGVCAAPTPDSARGTCGGDRVFRARGPDRAIKDRGGRAEWFILPAVERPQGEKGGGLSANKSLHLPIRQIRDNKGAGPRLSKPAGAPGRGAGPRTSTGRGRCCRRVGNVEEAAPAQAGVVQRHGPARRSWSDSKVMRRLGTTFLQRGPALTRLMSTQTGLWQCRNVPCPFSKKG